MTTLKFPFFQPLNNICLYPIIKQIKNSYIYCTQWQFDTCYIDSNEKKIIYMSQIFILAKGQWHLIANYYNLPGQNISSNSFLLYVSQ